jgi:organic radical activating enzyme
MRHKTIFSRNIEYGLTEHCNLSCYACDHASPLLPKKFASLESFSRDITALSKVFHSLQLRFVGGEPLLHPRLFDFLSAARRVGISDKIVLITNGTFLHAMPEKFYSLIDRLFVSIYPGVKHRVDWAECSKLCRVHGVDLRIWHKDKFAQTLVNNPIENPKLVRKIFSACEMAGDEGCPTVHEGRFYGCSIAPFMAPRLAQLGIPFDNRESDGVPLHDNPALYDGVERVLKGREPFSACSYCLGSSGPKVRHRQLDRRGRAEWIQEDDRAAIDSTKKRLLS